MIDDCNDIHSSPGWLGQAERECVPARDQPIGPDVGGEARIPLWGANHACLTQYFFPPTLAPYPARRYWPGVIMT